MNDEFQRLLLYYNSIRVPCSKLPSVSWRRQYENSFTVNLVGEKVESDLKMSRNKSPAGKSPLQYFCQCFFVCKTIGKPITVFVCLAVSHRPV